MLYSRLMRLSTSACDARLFQLVVDDPAASSHRKLLALLAARFDRFMHLLVADRIQIAESQVFQFAANFAHAQPVRDGRVNLQRLFGDLLLALRRQVLQRPHVVQAVGQLDQHDADVVHHGQHHLAQVFRLLLFAGGKINLADLGDAFDNVRDLLAELLANIDNRDRRVFHRVVQQPGGDRHRIHLHFRQHQRHFQRMHQIRLAGGARLPA